MQILKQVHICQVGGEKGWQVTVLRETTNPQIIAKPESEMKTHGFKTWRQLLGFLNGLEP